MSRVRRRGFKPLQALIAESRQSAADNAQLQAAVLSDELPVFVLTGEKSLEIDGWDAGQAQLAAPSASSVRRIIVDNSHNIPADTPEAITSCDSLQCEF